MCYGVCFPSLFQKKKKKLESLICPVELITFRTRQQIKMQKTVLLTDGWTVRSPDDVSLVISHEFGQFSDSTRAYFEVKSINIGFNLQTDQFF